MITLLLAFGLIIGVVHYFSERVSIKENNRMKFVSFTSGILITYLFLHLFPSLFDGGLFLNRISLVFLLVGFTIFHVVEKYVYKHSKSTENLKKELKEAHTISLFIYYIVMGIVIFNIAKFAGILDVTLFFIPVLFHAALSSISFSGLHAVIRGNFTVKIFISASTLIGMLIAFFLEIPHLVHIALMGSVIGMLLYITIVDSIPKEREGTPEFFLIGIGLYSIIIALSWII